MSSAMNAAMLHVPLGTANRVTSLHLDSNAMDVTVTERCPYVMGRTIDLTPAAFEALTGSLAAGVVQVRVQVS